MPIVFVHGVANRREEPLWEGSRIALEVLLRRYVAPAISRDPKGVSILFPYWGDLGASFAWGGASRPHSAFLGQGAADESEFRQALALAALGPALAAMPAAASTPSTLSGFVPLGPGAVVEAPLDLAELPPDTLADLASALLGDVVPDRVAHAHALVAADVVAHDPALREQLRALPPGPAQVEHFVARLGSELDAGAGWIGMGPGGRLREFADRLGETVSRALGVPGWMATQVLSEVRRPLHAALSLFFGDVFAYLGGRRSAALTDPGPIPARILEALVTAGSIQAERGGEPLVVLSHSMGGQILYDLVTTFMPRTTAPKIDYWCASASQIGLFEELKLFLASSHAYHAGNLVPNPCGAHLGHWWNVWDPNDFLSFTARDIFDDVDDGSFDGGLSVISAHGGYLVRASFFREFAERLRIRLGAP